VSSRPRARWLALVTACLGMLAVVMAVIAAAFLHARPVNATAPTASPAELVAEADTDLAP
jgi:hypothetical protein